MWVFKSEVQTQVNHSDEGRWRLFRLIPCSSLSARLQSDRRPGHRVWSWHRSQSAFPAGRHDGPPGLTCHHDAPEPQCPPTQNQYAQVRSSCASIHSSTKTPTSRNATPEVRGQRSTNHSRRAEPEFSPASPSWLRSLTFPGQIQFAAGGCPSNHPGSTLHDHPAALHDPAVGCQ